MGIILTKDRMVMGKSAILLMLFFIFFNLMMAIVKADELAPVIESPELPGSIESGEQIEPQITIIRQEDKIIEEYRINNNLYMVKITPVIGMTYYLIDHDGDGKLDVRKNELDDVIVPQWVLITW
tara:strand:- start:1500 stop:1874 length:375 start_codon:yes stop_codon:yes gene_type:complete